MDAAFGAEVGEAGDFASAAPDRDGICLLRFDAIFEPSGSVGAPSRSVLKLEVSVDMSMLPPPKRIWEARLAPELCESRAPQCAATQCLLDRFASEWQGSAKGWGIIRSKLVAAKNDIQAKVALNVGLRKPRRKFVIKIIIIWKNMAGGEGFEPPGRLHARRFSRPEQSTTLPPTRRRRGLAGNQVLCNWLVASLLKRMA